MGACAILMAAGTVLTGQRGSVLPIGVDQWAGASWQSLVTPYGTKAPCRLSNSRAISGGNAMEA